VATAKTPDESKNEQAKNCIAASKMPHHGVAAHIACNDQSHDQYGQCPMEDASWPIPNANLNHAMSFNAKDALSRGFKIMRNYKLVQRH
jgi:hypothetical protein